ncbi:MAG: hypothetical protein WC838_05160 [Candidatus Margulisiibacteriota bacterium]|jgi:hypothetical protein
MVRGTDWYSSSVYRAGWKSDEGYNIKPTEVSYVGLHAVGHPAGFKERVKWWSKTISNALIDEDEEVSEEIAKNCEQRGLKVFAPRK